MHEMTRRGFFETAGMAAVAPSVEAIAAQGRGSAGGSAATEKNIVFGKAGNTDLRLDIYRPPAGTEKRMATIHIHGGGFTAGSKDTLADRVAPFVALGYVAIPVQYRLAGEAKWPAQIEDVKAAIRWTRANAKSLGVDPERIAVVGYSAGGHLALFAAGTANRPEFEGKNGTPRAGTQLAACAAYYPATEVRTRPDGTANILLPAGSDEAAHRAASPTSYIAKGFPPTVIFHGTADVTIPLESSERLFKQFREAQIPVEFHAFEGVPHAFDSNPEFAKSAAELANFFIDRKVLNPRTYPPFGGGGGRRSGQ
ncbi:MAG TPA: alpha/beta hydrolase [Terriglobia bacterium]|nr:alpha/beta hydrolase [Terriglobia bacterium]